MRAKRVFATFLLAATGLLATPAFVGIASAGTDNPGMTFNRAPGMTFN
jgi:hypothetical protein